MDQARFAGTRVPEPQFPDDDGTAPPALTQVLTRYGAADASAYDVVAELTGSRLLVPVVAVLDEAEAGPDGPHQHSPGRPEDRPGPHHETPGPHQETAGSGQQSPGPPEVTPGLHQQSPGLRREKDSHMATVTLLNSDGRRGLLAFTSVANLQRWEHTARPVAAGAPRVAQAALQEGADAVLIDAAGPVPFALEGAGLHAVAAGQAWLPPHLDPVVAAAVGQAVASVDPGLTYRIGAAGDLDADLLVVIEARPAVTGPDPTGPDPIRRDQVEALGPDLATALAAALAADPALQQRCPAGIALALP